MKPFWLKKERKKEEGGKNWNFRNFNNIREREIVAVESQKTTQTRERESKKNNKILIRSNIDNEYIKTTTSSLKFC